MHVLVQLYIVEVPVTTPTTEMAFTASGREENPVLEDSWQLASLLLR